jgi:hypothetical protein
LKVTLEIFDKGGTIMSLEKVRDTVPSGVILENETVGGMGFLSLDTALCLALESSSENLNPPSDPSESRE